MTRTVGETDPGSRLSDDILISVRLLILLQCLFSFIFFMVSLQHYELLPSRPLLTSCMIHGCWRPTGTQTGTQAYTQTVLYAETLVPDNPVAPFPSPRRHCRHSLHDRDGGGGGATPAVEWRANRTRRRRCCTFSRVARLVPYDRRGSDVGQEGLAGSSSTGLQRNGQEEANGDDQGRI